MKKVIAVLTGLMLIAQVALAEESFKIEELPMPPEQTLETGGFMCKEDECVIYFIVGGEIVTMPFPDFVIETIQKKCWKEI